MEEKINNSWAIWLTILCLIVFFVLMLYITIKMG